MVILTTLISTWSTWCSSLVVNVLCNKGEVYVTAWRAISRLSKWPCWPCWPRELRLFLYRWRTSYWPCWFEVHNYWWSAIRIAHKLWQTYHNTHHPNPTLPSHSAVIWHADATRNHWVGDVKEHTGKSNTRIRQRQYTVCKHQWIVARERMVVEVGEGLYSADPPCRWSNS